MTQPECDGTDIWIREFLGKGMKQQDALPKKAAHSHCLEGLDHQFPSGGRHTPGGSCWAVQGYEKNNQ